MDASWCRSKEILWWRDDAPDPTCCRACSCIYFPRVLVFIMIINWIEVSQFSVRLVNITSWEVARALNVTELMNLETRKETNRLLRRSTGNRLVAPKWCSYHQPVVSNTWFFAYIAFVMFLTPGALERCFQFVMYLTPGALERLSYPFTCFQVLTYASWCSAIHIYSWLCVSWTLGLCE